MEKAKIVKAFSKLGYLLDPHFLEYLAKNEEEIDVILASLKAKKPNKKILTLDFAKNLIKDEVEIKILKKKIDKAEIDLNSFLNSLGSRYEKIRKILMKRMELVNLISISKISQRTKKFSIIGMILEKYIDKSSILIEDLTGQIELFIKEKFDLLVEDEIIGAVCKRVGDKIYAEKIIFPDIPVMRKLNYAKKECKAIFVTSSFLKKNFDKFSDLEGPTVIFLFGKVDEKIIKIAKKSRLISFFDIQNAKVVTDPCLIEIEGVKIFFSSGNFLEKYKKEFKVSEEKVIIELIKKRHLNPKIEKNLEEIYYLDPIPDIIAICSKKPYFLNYKGTTIVACSDEQGFEIDLKKREVKKLAFSR